MSDLGTERVLARQGLLFGSGAPGRAMSNVQGRILCPQDENSLIVQEDHRFFQMSWMNVSQGSLESDNGEMILWMSLTFSDALLENTPPGS